MSPPGSYFLDTNILLYAISLDPADQFKRARAQQLLDAGGPALSLQVLQEFAVQTIRPKRTPAISPEDARALTLLWRRFPVQENTLELLDSAYVIHARTNYSFWDSLIVAAAQALGCRILYTEDLDDGRIIDGMRIVNPFRDGARLP